MSIAAVREYFRQYGLEERVQEFDVSSATVDLAAAALGCAPERIAKSLTFLVDDRCVMIVTAGDAKIDNSKYKNQFGTKAKMLSAEQVKEMVGHTVGGVFPFAIKKQVDVYLDVSMRRFPSVFPACGSNNSAIELSCEELTKLTQNLVSWVDLCKAWQ